jgi:hypothetical protein
MGYGHISNFPNGFAYGVNIKGMPVLNTYGGDVYWVDSGVGGDGNKGTFDSPFATLDYAIGRCTANNGDIIMLKPGHAETVASAGAIAVDVAGVTIIGLGDGADRPTFTFSATASTITMSAASCVLKNILIKPSIDSVASPIVVSAANCTIDVEVQDASATVECVSAILTTAAADNLDIKLKYRGFLAGNACVSPIKLVGVDTARIYVDFYGVADTAVVEMSGTNCHDIDIAGLFYNNGTTLTKNVVDSAGGSTWSVRGWDGNSNANFSGGDNAALASDDASAIAAAVATAQADLDILTGANGANLLTATQASIDAIETDTGTTLPGLIATAQADLDIITGATGANLLTATQASIDAIETDTSTTIPGLIATAQADLDILTGATGANLLAATQASIDAIETDTGTTLPATMAAMPQCVVKADGACLSGLDPLFTIAGGPVRCKIVGLVTTVIGSNAVTFRLQHITTDPAATVELNAGAVTVTDDAAGTFYYNIGDTSVFTPSGGLGFALLDPVTVEETEFLLAPGVVQCLGTAANTGVIAWYMTYTPLSPLSVVTAAA